MSANDWELQQTAKMIDELRRMYERERAPGAQQIASGDAYGGLRSAATAGSKAMQAATPIPAPPDTPLSLALLEALSPAFGSMGFAFVEVLYLPSALRACVRRVRTVACETLSTPEPDLCAVKMKNGALGIVRLPQSVLDLAVAQQAANALTD